MSLQKIQEQLKAPKNQYNDFGKYKYRNCEDILEALKPMLAEFGYTLLVTDEMVEVGGRVYVKATPRLYDKIGEPPIAETCGYAREPESRKGMDASQITGASSSYARKYALNGMFLIDDTKDADSGKPPEDDKRGSKKDTKKPDTTKTDDRITEPQRKKLFAMAKADTLDIEFIKTILEVDSLKDILKSRAKKIFDDWPKFKEWYIEKEMASLERSDVPY